MISIIVPLYNFGSKGDYCFKKCIESIRNQSYNDYEVLLMENLSTDDTIDAVKKYLAEINDERFKLYILDKPGLTNARNQGLSYAKGDLITFIDGDDTISEDYLQAGYDLITNNDVDMVIYNWAFYYIKKDKIKKQTNYENNIFERPQTDNRLYTALAWAKLIKTSVLLDNNITFDAELTGGEDTLFGVDVYFASKKIATSEKSIYFYTQNRKNQTTYTMKPIVAISTLKSVMRTEAVYKKYNVLQENILFLHNQIIEIIIGNTLGNSILRHIPKKEFNVLVNQYKNKIMSINVNELNCQKWKISWFKRFQKALSYNLSFYFIKFISLYYKLIIKPFKIKKYR